MPTDWGDLPHAAGGPNQGAAGFDARRQEEAGGWAHSAEGIFNDSWQAAASPYCWAWGGWAELHEGGPQFKTKEKDPTWILTLSKWLGIASVISAETWLDRRAGFNDDGNWIS